MMDIRAVMSAAPVTARREWPVGRVLELLIEHEISGLPVVDDENRIVGIVSEKDLLALFGAEAPPNVGAVMTRNPTAFAVDAPLVELVDCLMAHDFRRVLVHERGKLVGVVSRSDLMPALLEILRDRAAGI